MGATDGSKSFIPVAILPLVPAEIPVKTRETARAMKLTTGTESMSVGNPELDADHRREAHLASTNHMQTHAHRMDARQTKGASPRPPRSSKTTCWTTSRTG